MERRRGLSSTLRTAGFQRRLHKPNRAPPLLLLEARRGRWTSRLLGKIAAYMTTLHHAPGLPGSMMPVIYGNSYQIVASLPAFVTIRYEMITRGPSDPHRWQTPCFAGDHVCIWAIRSAIGTATRL